MEMTIRPHSHTTNEPWRVEPNPDSKMFPWRCVGPEGLESGHQDKKGAQREARKYNLVYEMGRAHIARLSPERSKPCQKQ